jgi:hypothetical protein
MASAIPIGTAIAVVAEVLGAGLPFECAHCPSSPAAPHGFVLGEIHSTLLLFRSAPSAGVAHPALLVGRKGQLAAT